MNVGLAGGLLVVCASLGAGSVSRASETAELATPAATGSGQPFLWSDAGGVLLSWLEPGDGGTHRLRVARMTESGWSNPLTVVEGTNLVVNWADVPSVIRLADGRLAAHWMELINKETFTYGVRIKTSADGGASWSEALTPHRDGAAAEHGFVSLFQAPDSALGVVWLDGRNYAGQEQTHGGEPQAPGPSMETRFTTVSATGVLGQETVIDGRTCDCCPTAAVPVQDAVVLAYRDRSEDDIRDISVTRLEKGSWTEPRPIHRDGWKIDGCPVNGPAISALGEKMAVAWSTATNDTPAVLLAFSGDAGRSFGAPVRVDDGKPIGRVDVELLEDGSAVVCWLERQSTGAEVRFRKVGVNGPLAESATLASVEAGRVSGYPRMVRAGNELVFAWTATSDQTQQVKTARRTP